MLFGLIFLVVVFLIIVVLKGKAKYDEHNKKAGEQDLYDWYHNKYRDTWQNKDRHNKNY